MDELFLALHSNVGTTYDALQEILPATNKMDFPAFGSFYCMLLEEWCLSHHRCITEVIDQISMLIHDVNAELGSYGDENPDNFED